MELIAVSPAGRQIIERYAASGFRVSGIVYQGPVLVFPDRTLSWPAAALTPESLAPVVDYQLGDRHPQIVFSEQPQEGVVVDEHGRTIVTRSYSLLPEVVRLLG